MSDIFAMLQPVDGFPSPAVRIVSSMIVAALGLAVLAYSARHSS